MAVCHLAGCLETSIEVNQQGKHSAAICLIRQCVEALTIVEIGIQDESYAEPLLVAWSEGKKTQGQLRADLEQNVWPNYGNGLWDEPWAKYFGNLSRAVQPYAHYSPELQGWQWVTVTQFKWQKCYCGNRDKYLRRTQSRGFTLLHVLVIWTLGRILLASKKSKEALQLFNHIAEVGQALASSKLLFHKEDWGVQLVPYMFFQPGYTWFDP